MTTRQPLSETSRRILRSRSRIGLLALVFAVAATAGIVFGIAVKTPGVIALSPIAALLWWVVYSFGLKTLHDLRVGLEEHYDGPWEQRLLRRLRIPDVVLVKLPRPERGAEDQPPADGQRCGQSGPHGGVVTGCRQARVHPCSPPDADRFARSRAAEGRGASAR